MDKGKIFLAARSGRKILSWLNMLVPYKVGPVKSVKPSDHGFNEQACLPELCIQEFDMERLRQISDKNGAIICTDGYTKEQIMEPLKYLQNTLNDEIGKRLSDLKQSTDKTSE